VIEGEKMNPIGVVRQARAMEVTPERPVISVPSSNTQYQVKSGFELIIFDGSWDQMGEK
jgi:hypothetical protein